VTGPRLLLLEFAVLAAVNFLVSLLLLRWTVRRAIHSFVFDSHGRDDPQPEDEEGPIDNPAERAGNLAGGIDNLGGSCRVADPPASRPREGAAPEEAPLEGSARARALRVRPPL